MTVEGWSVRDYQDADEEAVLALVAKDRLTGQPEATPAMLAGAMAGHPPASTPSAALHDTATQVVCDETGRVRGAVCHGMGSGDRRGFVSWLYAAEDPAAVAALLDAALPRFARRSVHAFGLPTPLSPWAPGLPVRARPVTRAALESAGFTPRGRWRYLHRALPPRAAVGEVRTYPIAEVSRREHPLGWEFDLREPDGTLIGHATVGEPVGGVSSLRWIAVEPERRGRGLGRLLGDQVAGQLARTGARELVTLLEEQPPADSRAFNPHAAGRLLHALGFTEEGPLWSFSRP